LYDFQQDDWWSVGMIILEMTRGKHIFGVWERSIDAPSSIQYDGSSASALRLFSCFLSSYVFGSSRDPTIQLVEKEGEQLCSSVSTLLKRDPRLRKTTRS
jgi:serine/threonine protein kinase